MKRQVGALKLNRLQSNVGGKSIINSGRGCATRSDQTGARCVSERRADRAGSRDPALGSRQIRSSAHLAAKGKALPPPPPSARESDGSGYRQMRPLHYSRRCLCEARRRIRIDDDLFARPGSQSQWTSVRWLDPLRTCRPALNGASGQRGSGSEAAPKRLRSGYRAGAI